jgi:hypothetical protein
MPTPSLILVPARFKTGKLYTPLATTSGGVVLGASGDFNVTRATTATRVNANGLIEVVASGIPRLDYFASGGVVGCPALLVEPSAQNIMAQSETLSVSGDWTQTAVLATGWAIASPDGLVSGSLLVATSGSSQHNINRNATTSITSGTTITASCFFKAHGTNNFAQLVIGGFTFSPASPFANFNLSGNGAITTGTYSSAFIQNYGNGWYRCGLTATAAANGTNNLAIVPILASGTARNPVFQGDGVNGVYAWGAQVESGSVATSYIPTSTAAVTRNADVVTLSGAVSGCIGQTEGTIYAEVDLTTKLGGLNGDFIAEVLFDTNTKLLIRRQDGSERFAVFFRVSGTPVFDRELILLTAGIHKFALAYKSGNNNAYIDGSSVLTGAASGGLTNTFTITSAMNRIDLGHSSLIANTQFKDRIRSFALYTTRLTNAELAALTTL